MLWARRSLLDIERTTRGASHPSDASSPPEDLLRKFAGELEKPIPKVERRSVMAFAKPIEQINYSLLHNNRNLFQYFYIRKPQCVGTIKDLNVDVSLQARLGIRLTEKLRSKTVRRSHSIRETHDFIQRPDGPTNIAGCVKRYRL